MNQFLDGVAAEVTAGDRDEEPQQREQGAEVYGDVEDGGEAVAEDGSLHNLQFLL